MQVICRCKTMVLVAWSVNSSASRRRQIKAGWLLTSLQTRQKKNVEKRQETDADFLSCVCCLCTDYYGKYINKYNVHVRKGRPRIDVPPGWSRWFCRLGNTRYLNYQLGIGSSTADSPGNFTVVDTKNKYITKQLSRVISEDLGKLRNSTKPFFFFVSLPSAHGVEVAQKRYRNTFSDPDILPM